LYIYSNHFRKWSKTLPRLKIKKYLFLLCRDGKFISHTYAACINDKTNHVKCHNNAL